MKKSYISRTCLTIVILSILLVIVITKINDIINNAQKGAYKSTNSVIVSELRDKMD